MDKSQTASPASASSNLQEALALHRGSDPVLDYLMAGGPVTREQYLSFNHPEGVPDPYPAELEASLPPPLQVQSLAQGGSVQALPEAPLRKDFKTEEDFLEARDSWRHRVGRIKALAASHNARHSPDSR